MRQLLKIVLGIVGLFIVLVGCFNLYIAVGPSVVGPKARVDNMCVDLIGLNLDDAIALYPEGSGVDFLEPNTHEIFSESRGEFLCVCQVSVDESDLIMSYEVPCLD